MIKKLLVPVLTLVLLCIFSTLTMAQVFNLTDEYSMVRSIWNKTSQWHTVQTWNNTDNWYSVSQEKPNVQIYFNDHGFSKLGVKGYASEQTFFDVATKAGNSDIDYFAGSFLFKNGFFLGGSYNGDSKNHISYIAPGFRLSLNDAGFIALSCDYRTSNQADVDDKIVGYDVYYKYFVEDAAKIGGEVYFPKDEDTYWWMGVNVKPADVLVVGAYYETQGDANNYHGGFTFTPEPLIIDAEIGDDGTKYYAVSSMLMMSDTFRLGADYFKYRNKDDGSVHAKLNFGDEKANFILKYQFKNDTYPAIMSAAVKINLGN